MVAEPLDKLGKVETCGVRWDDDARPESCSDSECPGPRGEWVRNTEAGSRRDMVHVVVFRFT